MGQDKLLKALKELGAGDAGHSNRTLLEHLNGIYKILQNWGNDEHVCLAGLFHSIYGTVYFGTATVDSKDRENIQEIVGSDAEQLAYQFCAINRQELFEQSNEKSPYPVKDRFTDQVVSVNETDFRKLFEIEIANFIEQVPDMSKLNPEKLPWYIEYFGRCRGFVTDNAYREYKNFFVLN